MAVANYGDLLSSGGFGNLRGYDIQGWGGLDNEWGLAYFHTKHALVFNGIWDVPLKGPVLGGWSLSWVLMAYSGQPQTIGCTIATTSGANCIALLVGDPYAGQARHHAVLQPGRVQGSARGDRERPDRLCAARRSRVPR